MADQMGAEESPQENNVSGLFSSVTFDSVEKALKYAKCKHDFDLRAIRDELGLDFYGMIKLINYIRDKASSSDGSTEEARVARVRSGISKREFDESKYMKPTIPDDPMLYELDFDNVEASIESKSSQTLSNSTEVLKRKIAELEQENKALHQNVTSLKETSEPDEEQDPPELDEKDIGEEEAPTLEALVSAPEPNSDPNVNPDPKAISDQAVSAEAKKGEKEETDGGDVNGAVNIDYFSGYSMRGIHEEMLKDRARTEAYRDAMYRNRDRFQDKIVLDVGCGTGILCMFAAKAGARLVIGIDASDIIDKTRLIVSENGLSSKIILIKGMLENVTLPKHIQKVDIIISEWMGYFLLFESMLPTVLTARDRWLSPGGSVYPNKATMYIAGANMKQYRASYIDFWKHVYGFDMSCMITPEDRFPETSSEIVSSSSLVTTTYAFKSFDIQTVDSKQLDFSSSFTLQALRSEALERIIVHFDAEFDHKLNNPITLSTGVGETDTHWRQTVFYLAKPLKLVKGEVVKGTLTAKRRKNNHREYNVTISYWIDGKDSAKHLQDFSIRVSDS
ncbi:hypothetical protein AAMO2058_000689300 [Amorphochlora amoebiformis]